MRWSGLCMRLDVLIATKSESKPTLIMYKTTLNWIRVSDCLQKLIELGLVEKKVTLILGSKTKRDRYFVTDKGNEVLRLWSNLKLLLGT